MARWLIGFAWIALFACSSTSTNEGAGGSAGAPSGGGGSAGAASGGGSGGVLDCPWPKCLFAVNNSQCQPLAVQCVGPGCDDVTQYASCVCKGLAVCKYPTDEAGSDLVDCIATDPTLAPPCLNLPGCTPAGKSCVGNPEKCCPGTQCDGSVCL